MPTQSPHLTAEAFLRAPVAPLPVQGPIIPGAREPNTVTSPREPGSAHRPDAEAGLSRDAGTMDSATIAEHRNAGGGGVSQRRPRVAH